MILQIAASYSKLQEAQKKVDAKEEELNGLMEVWEQASAELDAFGGVSEGVRCTVCRYLTDCNINRLIEKFDGEKRREGTWYE